MNIIQKTQNAFRDYLAGVTFTNWTPAVLSGINADNDGDDNAAPLPRIVCQCQSATMDGHESNHYIAQIEIIVRENADDTSEDDFLAHTGEVGDALITDSIADDVSGATYTAQLVEWQDQSYEVEGRSWVARLRGEAHCVGRQLT